MSTGEIIWYIALTLIGVSLSSLFSGMETGIYTLNRVRLTVRGGRGEPAAMRLQRFIRQPFRLLSTILVGNNIANFLGSFGIAAILTGFGLSQWETVVINALILMPILFVFGETLPKDLFRTNADVWTYRISPFLAVCWALFTWTLIAPLVEQVGKFAARLVGGEVEAPTTARARVSQLLREGEGAGLLNEMQTTLADRALNFGTRTVAGEMIPWKNVITLPVEASGADRMARLQRVNHTRLPVVERDGTVVGVVSLLDIVLNAERPTRDLVEDPVLLNGDLHVPRALQMLRAKRQAMGIVVDARTQKPIGIVTLKDLVEPLTGELAAW